MNSLLIIKKPGGLFRGDTFEEQWEEKFFVLGNLGLVGMEKPNSDHINYYPFNEFAVEYVSEDRYNRKFCFELTPLISGKLLKD